MADYTQTAAVADNSSFGGPNAAQAANANAALGVATPSPISVSTLTQPATPINVPTAPTIDTHAATNASIPTPPATVDSIVNSALNPTTAQTQQTGILGKIADLMKSKDSLTTLQNTQETAAGVPELSKTLKSVTSQIMGYNDQAAKLALDASAGGTIENQASLDAQGLRSKAGQAPLTAAALSRNQIQQATIAGQALTAKAAYYAVSDNYTLAKDAADKAAQVQFDAVDKQVNYQKSLLDALAPQLSNDQAKQAAVLKANLDDRSSQIANQRDDFKAGQGLAITAMKLNPNSVAAQNAAQQALKLDPNDPQYLTKVAQLVAPYQQDPLAVQKQIADLAHTRAETAKLNKETQAINPGTPVITNPQAVKYKGALSVILGSEKLTKEQKTAVVNGVNNGEDPVAILKNQAKNIMGQTEATKITGYETAQSSLKDIQSELATFYANGGTTNTFSGNYEKVINKLGTLNDPKLVDLATQIQASLQIYRNAVSGTAYSTQEGADIASIFPGINKTQGLNTAILNGRMKAFDSVIDGSYRSALGSTYDALKTPAPVADTVTVVDKNGQTGTIPKAQLAEALKSGYRLPAGGMDAISK